MARDQLTPEQIEALEMLLTEEQIAVLEAAGGSILDHVEKAMEMYLAKKEVEKDAP